MLLPFYFGLFSCIFDGAHIENWEVAHVSRAITAYEMCYITTTPQLAGRIRRNQISRIAGQE